MVTAKASIESANPSSTSSVMVANFLSSQFDYYTSNQDRGGNVRQVNDIEEKDTWVNQAIPKRDQSERRPFALF